MILGLKSPPFSNVVVYYGLLDIYGAFPGRAVSEDDWYRQQFDVFRAMHEILDYRLILIARWILDDSLQELERAVAVEQARGGASLKDRNHS